VIRSVENVSMDLLSEIEKPRPSGAAIWGLSGAGFAIRTPDAIIYLDPWLVPPDPFRTTHRCYPIPFSPESVRTASAILSTHEHEDHCNIATLIGLNKNSKAPLFGPVSSIKKALDGGFPPMCAKRIEAGDSIQISDGVKLAVFKGSDPYEESAVMFLIQTGDVGIFHSGDTAYFEGFRKIGDSHRVDVALLNFGKQIPSPEKPYYMNSEKFSFAARDLRARIVVPMHWNLWQETREDPRQIEPALNPIAPDSKLVVIEGGEKLEI